jgi:hypothetical protein
LIRLNIRFRWNTGGPGARLPARAAVAHAALDSQVIKDTDPYVPFRTGATASSPLRGSRVGLITYSTPYARRIYYGVTFRFRKTFHPQATHHWLERSKRTWFPKWTRLVIRILTRGMGGRP